MLFKSKKKTTLPEISFEILSNFSNKTLERELANQKFGRLLVTTNLAEGYSSRPVTMGLLDSTGGRSAFSGGLCGQLLTGSFASGTFSCRLLGTRHFDSWFKELLFVILNYPDAVKTPR